MSQGHQDHDTHRWEDDGGPPCGQRVEHGEEKGDGGIPLSSRLSPTSSLASEAEPSDAWDTVLAALRTIRGIEVLDRWPVAAQPAGRASAIHTPVTFRPFGTGATAAYDLGLALATAITSTVAALTNRRSIEAFVPAQSRYGVRSVVVRAAGLPIVVAGSWLKGRGVYGLVVEAPYVQHVVLATTHEALSIAGAN